jgi:predicted aspartyl protease
MSAPHYDPPFVAHTPTFTPPFDADNPCNINSMSAREFGACEAARPSMSSPAPTYHQASGNTVPYTLNDTGGMVIAAIVGDAPATMLVDTGAAGSSVTEQLASALVASGQAVDTGRTVNIILADGSRHEEHIISINSLQVGNKRLSGIYVTVGGPFNILGLSELNRLGKMTMDASNRQLIFS